MVINLVDIFVKILTLYDIPLEMDIMLLIDSEV